MQKLCTISLPQSSGPFTEKKGRREMKRFWLSFMVFTLLGYGFQVNYPVSAADYPNKPINCIIPMEPGADGDINMRTIMKKTSEILGQPIVVINKPGAGQTMGYREVYKAKPDGYTIGTCAASLIMAKMQGMYPNNQRDFSLIAFGYHALPIVLASTKSKNTFQSMEEVLSFAKGHPKEVSMATTSVGGAYWIAAQMVESALKVQFNLIPQEGSAGYVVTAVAGGHTDLGVTSFSAAKGQIEAGKIRFLAVAGPQRYPGKYNYVKTMKELGYDASLSSFASVMGPPTMPKEIVAKLSAALKKAIKDPEVEKTIIDRNMIPEYMSPDDFLKFCNEQEGGYKVVLERLNMLKAK
jgi:tripartite-type tricarboxylate transporter receptor subunit TctC